MKKGVANILKLYDIKSATQPKFMLDTDNDNIDTSEANVNCSLDCKNEPWSW